MSKIEAALFYLVEAGQLIGVMITHVDDLFSTAEGNRYEAMLTDMDTSRPQFPMYKVLRVR